ncbi:hypothetical protein QVD17_01761 [Tagetes erecta]|uniref:NAC domain-containing protein n=1 Tax=Tagetes erecta TaxID=13708 RepID=A0AAD8LCQ5_TARER|nr:hypothetical protein QVD17_01761 [Tagetes erecta]
MSMSVATCVPLSPYVIHLLLNIIQQSTSSNVILHSSKEDKLQHQHHHLLRLSNPQLHSQAHTPPHQYHVQSEPDCNSTGDVYLSEPDCNTPGFRFHPTDEELITHYLSNKVVDCKFFFAKAIGVVDMNKTEPWDLPGPRSIQSCLEDEGGSSGGSDGGGYGDGDGDDEGEGEEDEDFFKGKMTKIPSCALHMRGFN